MIDLGQKKHIWKPLILVRRAFYKWTVLFQQKQGAISKWTVLFQQKQGAISDNWMTIKDIES